MLAEQWIKQDEEKQREVFGATGKKPKLKGPERTLFVSEEEYLAAIAGQKYLCDKEEHEGERVLEPGQYNNKGGKTCKQCKARKTARRKPPPKQQIVYETAEDWFKASANSTSDAHPSLTVGYCSRPRPDQFTRESEFQRAEVMRRDNNSDYRRQRNQLEGVKDHNNETARDRYAEKKETEAGREELKQKMERDNLNKKARIEAPVPEGMGRCNIGPHDVPLSDLQYDPVVDLGITDFKGDRSRDIVRSFCRNHFHGNLMKFRRHNDKPESTIKATRYQAEQDDIAYTLTFEEETGLFFYGNVCYFCGYSSDTECLGLNRIDILKKEFSKDNVIIACADCKKSRMGMPIPDFIKACGNIVNYQFLSVMNTEMIPHVQGGKLMCKGRPYSKFLQEAREKGRGVEITEEEYNKIQNESNCYLCGVKAILGPDRKDNTVFDYTKANSWPCCSTCNYMKRELPFDFFVAKCQKVVSKNSA